ncbi:zinc-dependent alcohol dehydrogenase family protein [Polymorphobacter sp.]|uniref:zinc-dependent alcohol dehydrogenase family protein n=1 Tax=Polymorphobacter sp. TaxID=1909290 RepID=UPI003F6F8C27
MKRWTVGDGTLAMAEVARPEPGPGEVLVQVKAASINARDLGIRGGFYPHRAGVVALSDGAGIVAGLGAGVEGWAVGDAVVGCFFPFWESGPSNADNHRATLGAQLDGFLADYAVIPASGLVKKPETLDFAEAATLPCAALTAWSALFTEGALKPGQHALVIGTGGVASFAVMFAKMAGARVTVISSSDARLAQAATLGADDGINYVDVPEWDAELLSRTGGRGVDVVVELGGGGTLAKSMAAVAVGGRIAVIGLISGVVATLPLVNILARAARIIGITVGHREDFRAMNAAIDLHGLKPVIAGRFGLEQAADCYAALEAGGVFGKLVIEV